MKIGIYGGSFDPPHKGHVIAAKRLIELFKFDEVWLMPCYKHPFSKKLSPPNDRFKMTKFLENKTIKTSDFEVKKKTISYTIDTLKSLAKLFPKNEFFWIIGSDQANSFTRWKKWKEIIEKFKLVIVPRNGIKQTGEKIKEILKTIGHQGNIIIVDKKNFPPIYISSSEIRKKIKNGKTVSDIMPKNIERYIIKHKLYL